ncbi:MAG TPA: hypothetical protein VJ482_13355, partial [Acidimicrobiia bacterium]|nr:hypothetical protein [Acidimicrobiia bacterium]
QSAVAFLGLSEPVVELGQVRVGFQLGQGAIHRRSVDFVLEVRTVSVNVIDLGHVCPLFRPSDISKLSRNQVEVARR